MLAILRPENLVPNTGFDEYTVALNHLPKSTAEDAGLSVSGISTSIRVCVPEDIAKNLEEARRTIAVAKMFDTVNLRVFGGGDLERHSHEELARFGRDCIARILDLDGARDLHAAAAR